MKPFTLVTLLFLLANSLFGQSDKLLISTKVSLQSDFQKATFKSVNFPFENKEYSATSLNWGIDILVEKGIPDNLSFYAGIGYFKNKFDFIRAYDHKLLNGAADSIPIGTSTKDYTFHILRFPIGITYRLIKKGKYSFNIGLENLINFSYQQVYNGRKPFPEANNKYSDFKYYGNSILLFGRISKQVSQSSFLQLEPFVRVSNIYKRKDPFLFEDNTKPYSRFFDAIGLSLRYSLTSKKS